MNIESMETSEKQHDYCLRCGRRLKNVEARKLGYGAVCFKKMQSSGKKLFLDVVNHKDSNIKSSQ